MPRVINLNSFKLQSLAVIVFICCLAIIFFMGLDTVRAKVRDIKRRADLRVIVKALDLYHDQYGSYPNSINDWQGWDLTYEYKGGELNFLKKLKDNEFIDKMVSDPINNDIFHYRYQKYNAGEYGCVSSFYILQIANFELSTDNNGKGECPLLNWVEVAPNGYTVQAFD